MSRLRMRDTFTLDGGIKRTADGYLAANARVARTGIQLYKGYEVGRPDLETVRVYRSPAEVFKKDAMRSFAHRPITFTHPTESVNSSNWEKYAIGHTGEDVVRDGDFIRVPMLLMDQAAVNAYEKDGVRELSMGYSTDLKWTPGKTRHGETYDAVQTDIRANHLAVVPVARGGAALRLGDKKRPTEEDIDEAIESGEYDPDDYRDATPFVYDKEFSEKRRETLASSGKAMAGGGYPIESEQDLKNAIHAIGRAKDRSATIAHIKKRASALGLSKLLPEQWDASPAATTNGDRVMRTITFDGVPIELDDQSAAVLQAHVARLNQRLTDQQMLLDKAKEDDEEAEEEESKAQDAMRKALDAKDGEIAALKKQLADALDPAQLDALVKDKADVMAKAAKVLDAKFVFDGKSSNDIRRAAVAAWLKDDATVQNMSDAGIEGAFRAIRVEASRPAAPPAQAPNGSGQDSNTRLKDEIARWHTARGAPEGTPEAAMELRDQAFRELEQRSTNAWKTPGGFGLSRPNQTS